MQESQPPASNLISIITPTNNPQWLRRAYASLRQQTCENWEWIIVPNHGAFWTAFGLDELLEPRLRIIRPGSDNWNDTGNIGYWKRLAAGYARGDVIVELDHDDELLPDALRLIREAFDKHRDYGMVYGNAAGGFGDVCPDQH